VTKTGWVRSASRRPFSISATKILTKVDIDLAEPMLDLLSFELRCERLDEFLVFRAVGKKNFHVFARSAGARLSLCLVAREHKSPEPKTSRISGPD
jgi:hypothetical protein